MNSVQREDSIREVTKLFKISFAYIFVTHKCNDLLNAYFTMDH